MLKRILSFLFFALVLQGLAQKSIPQHSGRWVHDEAGALSAETIGRLESTLKAERDSTSNQIAILILKSLEGDEISSYANRVFKEWKLGQEDKDNGVLFVMAIDDRKVRIEVGYGLEGSLTDLTSSRIIRNEVAPYFRRGDYENGVVAGTLAIMDAIKGSYKNTGGTKGEKTIPVPGLFKIIFFIVMILLFSRRRGGGGGYWYGGYGPMGGFGGSSGRWSGGGGGGFDFGGGGS
ncbi:MAG: TPM domain-containing protein, partial [Cyclobacteriaceae bacterium]